MTEKVITSFDEVLVFIDKRIKRINARINIIEQQAGISTGLISRWKKHDRHPNFPTLINVFNLLDIDLVLKFSLDLHVRPLEKKILSINELFEFIYWCADYNKTPIPEVERQSNISSGMFSRWKNNLCFPYFHTLMDIFNILNIIVVLKADISEEELVNEEILRCANDIVSSKMTISDKKLILNILNSSIKLSKN